MESPHLSIETFLKLAMQSEELPITVQASDDEIAILSAGADTLPKPLADLCRAVLQTWDQLDPATRAAGLLVLANALAHFNK